MLRLKQAINDCGIPQKDLVKATGFGKTQVSLTLNSGRLPADAERFKDGICNLVHNESKLGNWLSTYSFNVERLFEVIEDGRAHGGRAQDPPLPPPDLETMIYTLTGKASLNGGLGRNTCMRVMKALHLLSLVVPASLAAEAAAILKGDAPC